MDVSELINVSLSNVHAACGLLPPDDPRLPSLGRALANLRVASRKKVVSAEERAVAAQRQAFKRWVRAAPKIVIGGERIVDPTYERDHPRPPCDPWKE